MKSLLTAFFFIFGSLIQSKCQQPDFKIIEYASFDVNSHRTNVKDSVFVGLYCSITPMGFIQIYNPRDLQDSPKVYYSIQLSSTELKRVNSIFNSKQLLKTYLIKTQLNPNSMYAGSYDFFRVKYSNGKLDSICIIPPFASESFKEATNTLTDGFYGKRKREKINPFSMPNNFLYSLNRSYLESKYLPEIKNPPRFTLGK
jgi:hypothetical protein